MLGTGVGRNLLVQAGTTVGCAVGQALCQVCYLPSRMHILSRGSDAPFVQMRELAS